MCSYTIYCGIHIHLIDSLLPQANEDSQGTAYSLGKNLESVMCVIGLRNREEFGMPASQGCWMTMQIKEKGVNGYKLD
jgi:hypothetical protein